MCCPCQCAKVGRGIELRPYLGAADKHFTQFRPGLVCTLTPSLWEAGAGIFQIQAHPVQFSKTLCQKKKLKEWGCRSVGRLQI